MDYTHLHLLLNHFPIIGTLLGLGILAFGMIKDNTGIVQTSLYVFILVALISIPAFLTGEPAEEAIEHLPGVEESYIEAHEEAAETAIWIMELLGLLSLLTALLIYRKVASVRYLKYLVLLMGLVTFALMAQVGNLGGVIRHSEIRTNSIDGHDLEQNESEVEEDH